MSDIPNTLKQLEQYRVIGAKENAMTSAAIQANTGERFKEVLGILSDAPIEVRKKIVLPALRNMGICEEQLNTYFLLKFKKYWRLHDKLEKWHWTKKLERHKRKAHKFEKLYMYFESKHNDARRDIDAVYNQFAIALRMQGAAVEEEAAKGLTYVVLDSDRLEAKEKSKQIAKHKLSELDESLFKFPTFEQALGMAKEMVFKKPDEKEVQKVEPPKEPPPVSDKTENKVDIPQKETLIRDAAVANRRQTA